MRKKLPEGCTVAIAAREDFLAEAWAFNPRPKAIRNQRAGKTGYSPYRAASWGLEQSGERRCILSEGLEGESVSLGRYAGPVIALDMSGILHSQLWLIQSLPTEYFCIPQAWHMKPAHPPAFLPNNRLQAPGQNLGCLRISSLSLPSNQLIANPSGFSILAISAPSPSLLSHDHFCLRPHHLCLDLCRSLIIGLLASN